MEELSPYNNFDLLGHEEVEQTFLKACISGKLHHAWILHGPEGVGKSTFAYRIARFLISGKLEEDTGFLNEPITSLNISKDSPTAKLISAQSCADLLVVEREFDEKSGKYKKEILVSEIRKINDFLHKTSSNGNYRVVIVDGADKMNRNAQNAILKILEEPPHKTILILTATNIGSFLPTIKSRCRTLKLSLLANDTVCKLLELFCPDITADEKNKIALLSDGSIGTAIKIYQNNGLKIYSDLLSLLSKKLTTTELHKICAEYGASKNDASYVILISMLNNFLNRKILSLFKEDSLPKVLGIEDVVLEKRDGEELLKAKEEISRMIFDADISNLDRSKTLLYIFDTFL